MRELTALSGEPGVGQEWKGFWWDTALHCAGFGHHHIFWVTAGSWLICWALWSGPGLISLTARKDLEVIFSSPMILDTEGRRRSAWLPRGAMPVQWCEPFPSSWLQRRLYRQWLLANAPAGTGCPFSSSFHPSNCLPGAAVREVNVVFKRKRDFMICTSLQHRSENFK